MKLLPLSLPSPLFHDVFSGFIFKKGNGAEYRASSLQGESTKTFTLEREIHFLHIFFSDFLYFWLYCCISVCKIGHLNKFIPVEVP